LTHKRGIIMKRLSICLSAIALTLVLAFSGAAFTSLPSLIKKSPAPDKTHSPALKSAKQYIYYWYTYPDDTYNDWQTLANEEWEWEDVYYGVLIDDDPMGGTLIAQGYMTNAYPHNMFPAAYIYAHFVY